MKTSISAVDLDHLMHRGWPAIESVEVDGWLARLSDGITQRANSVLPVRSPHDPLAALLEIERLYGQRGLVPIFQISPAAQPSDLDALLAGRGYERRAPTLVQVAETSAVLGHLNGAYSPTEMADSPSEEWMSLWWSVDGRGGPDARETGRRILVGGPALYALLRDADGPVAVGRMALVDDWGGIYCMAVRPDARRLGHARAVLHALAQNAAHQGRARLWLQVVEGNDAARTLYGCAGFADVSCYHYRVQPSPPA